MEKNITAIGLLSGGLDSTLAAKLILEQGIKIVAVNFVSPFCNCTSQNAGCSAVVKAVQQLGDIPLKRISMGDEYLRMVRDPKYGHGSGMNPCIDCRIMKISMAAEYMKEIGADFLFTGEVLGQRPMSQHRRAIDIIDKGSGVKGLILRPLSAAHFEPTIPEIEGWVDRDKFLDITGRSRKPQIALAEEKGIHDFPCPAGGCKLTEKHFSDRLRDYLDHTENPSVKDMALLKVGRHFRNENGDKIIVARDEIEGSILEQLSRLNDHLLMPDFPAPTVILKGTDLKTAVEKMMQYTKHKTDDESVIWHVKDGVKENRKISEFTSSLS
ncbi:tRNA (5-methylaminomethyl-2-thiouridylate)-methyltransferase [Chitinispirillum alkaliphilum]|nr:tRNA (5-methylaminomethyl-2-thiouridylate)-methyltransferase [Chitinispirillum alkaliphilum]